jgi:hypothetical protein
MRDDTLEMISLEVWMILEQKREEVEEGRSEMREWNCVKK